MDSLPIELLQAILLYMDIDGDLVQFTGVCRKFALLLGKDVTFALAHIAHRFQLSKDGMKRFLQLNGDAYGRRSITVNAPDCMLWQRTWNHLKELWRHLEMKDPLPFAYKTALFIMASEVNVFKLYPFPAATTLRVVRSLEPIHTIDWKRALKFLAESNQTAAFDYALSNRLFGDDRKPLLSALEGACFKGRLDVVSLLLAYPTGNLGPLILDEPLLAAVEGNQLQCAQAILNDPIHGVTRDGRDAAFDESVSSIYGVNVPMFFLLVEHGVSSRSLNKGLEGALRKRRDFMSLFLQQPGIDPSYEDNGLVYESVYNDTCTLTKLLLADERVAGTVRYTSLARRALSRKSTAHVLLCLEVVEEPKKRKIVQIVETYLDTHETPADFEQSLRAAIQAIKTE
ncbi:hypothetical protein BJ741DRAFT_602359 [Chytriomyces cf. hyalinus JEL632]|nr:hypothetical protein BJ741DRAFT_602359 [Chytriomyces cf. hyalinus JEL632]